MKELEDLSRFDKVVLSACCKANKYSLKAHNPLGKIRQKLEPKYHKYLKRIIKFLCKNGFLRKHTGSRGISYYLNSKGLKAGNILKEEHNL